MKKLISVILTIAMIASALSAMTITASANATWAGEGNSSWWDYDYESGIDYVEALYFENEPTIDGYVTEAEWGERTIEMYSSDFGTVNEPCPYYNSFFYWKKGSAEQNPMEALVWLRWDENYYYVAAIVHDFDGHSLKHGQSDTWNGDAIEFRVDPEGPNAATGGDDYDPNIGTPWSDVTKIPDFLVGYVQIAGGFVECFESTNDKGLTAYSRPVFGEVKAAVAPSEMNSENPLGYHEDAAAGYTTYEIAIPWKYIYENNLVPNYNYLTEAEKAPYTLEYSKYSYPSGRPNTPSYNPGNLKGGIGRELGMSLVVLNAAKGENAYKSFISWGSGVTSVQTEIAPQTCAGSNCVTLVAESVEQSSYAKYDPSKLNPSLANKTYDNVFYDYLAGDTGRTTAISDANALKTLTYDNLIPRRPNDTRTYELAEDQEYWGSYDLYRGSVMDVGGDHGHVLSFDRMLEDYEDWDGNVFVAGVDPIDQFYIDTTVIPESSWNAGDGMAWTYPLSYTFEFDVMYTGNEIVQEGRASELGNLFGGASADYYCGYDFENRRFVVRSFYDYTDVIAYSNTYELQPNTWYNWKFQYDNETCTMRLIIDNEVIFNISNRYFYYSNERTIEEGTLLCWWFINTQMKMDNVKIYNFYDYVLNGSTGDDSNDDNQSGSGSSGPGSVVDTPTTGGNITVDKDNDIEPYFYVSVYETITYKNLESLEFNISFDSDMFEFIDIIGLEDNDYIIEQKDNGKYTITIVNIKKVNEAEIGSTLFKICLKGKSGANAEYLADPNTGIKIAYTYKTMAPVCGGTHRGDVDINGAVNAFDVIHLKRALAGLLEDENMNFDVNEDGSVNAKDLLLLKQILTGKI